MKVASTAQRISKSASVFVVPFFIVSKEDFFMCYGNPDVFKYVRPIGEEVTESNPEDLSNWFDIEGEEDENDD